MFRGPKSRLAIGLALVVGLCGAGGSCSDNTPERSSAATHEQDTQNRQMEQFMRNQPVPSFDWSLERHMLIQLYAARQRATNTFSVVQSDYTGKILWQCNSIGFPLPYSTQLTNPQQVVGRTFSTGGNGVAAVAIGQQEPNGLFPPPTADGTWVPCVDEKGKITPVYEEKHVTVFLRPVTEQNGQLVVSGAASLAIEPHQ